MKLLLDTHVFIWWDSDPSRLSETALTLCSDPTNEMLLSVASLWEMQIKHQLGKLHLHLPLADIVSHQQAANALTVLPITLAHVLALAQLPSPSQHRDPFDRLLIAQARCEDATLITADAMFASYPVRVAW